MTDQTTTTDDRPGESLAESLRRIEATCSPAEVEEVRVMLLKALHRDRLERVLPEITLPEGHRERVAAIAAEARVMLPAAKSLRARLTEVEEVQRGVFATLRAAGIGDDQADAVASELTGAFDAWSAVDAVYQALDTETHHLQRG